MYNYSQDQQVVCDLKTILATFRTGEWVNFVFDLYMCFSSSKCMYDAPFPQQQPAETRPWEERRPAALRPSSCCLRADGEETVFPTAQGRVCRTAAPSSSSLREPWGRGREGRDKIKSVNMKPLRQLSCSSCMMMKMTPPSVTAMFLGARHSQRRQMSFCSKQMSHEILIISSLSLNETHTHTVTVWVHVHHRCGLV